MNPLMPRRQALLQLCACALAPWAAQARAQDLPGDSIYQLRVSLTDQHGQLLELAATRGHVVLVSMFYSSCEQVCPMLFETIRLTLKALPIAERERVKVTMISFDPARDTVAVLLATAQAHHCDPQWTLARTDEPNVRKIAAVLGVQYRRLPNGEFNHSTTIQLLDTEGRIAARSSTLGAVDPALVKAVRKVLARRG